jgi:hypothetical protein
MTPAKHRDTKGPWSSVPDRLSLPSPMVSASPGAWAASPVGAAPANSRNPCMPAAPGAVPARVSSSAQRHLLNATLEWPLRARSRAVSSDFAGLFTPRNNLTGKSAKTCPAPFAKIFWFSEEANHLYIPRCPAPLGGATRDRHGRGAGCGGRGGAFDEQRRMRTAKTCGPDTPTLVSSSRQGARATVARKPGHRGERVISRKPLRGECRVIPV